MRRLRLHAIAALAGLLLGGCAADYKRYSEESFSAAPDLSGACQFQWSTGNAWYRVRDGNGFGWGNVKTFGHANLQQDLQALPPQCPAAAGSPPAVVSVFYAEYSDRKNRSRMMLPATALQMFTLGLAPLELTSYYAACVETTTPAGPRRAAVAHGKIDAQTNLWGTSDNLLHKGRTLRRQSVEQLLHDLTRQSWHKLWTPGQGLVAGTGCRDVLNALLK